MIVVGLTGSIGMGKSTALRAFADLGAATWDADAAVHRLYAPGGGAAPAVAALAPEAVGEGGVDRNALRRAILAEPTLIKRLEAAVHPLVTADRAAFLDRARAEGARMAVCDVPLLFETGAENQFDAVVVVSAPEATQRERVMARKGMTPETLAAILARQLPDAEKRKRADFVVDTGGSIENARAQIEAIAEKLEQGWRR